MKSTYTVLAARIAKLQVEADQAKTNEKAGVIERIRIAIDAYDITGHDLFGPVAVAPKAAEASPVKRKAKKQGKAYVSADGETWGGLGPRPAWLRIALKSGRTLEEFRAY